MECIGGARLLALASTRPHREHDEPHDHHGQQHARKPRRHQRQTHSPPLPTRCIQAPANAFHFADQIDRAAYGVEANVDGKNCMRPDAPEGLRANGFRPLSQRALRTSMCVLTRCRSAALRMHGTTRDWLHCFIATRSGQARVWQCLPV